MRETEQRADFTSLSQLSKFRIFSALGVMIMWDFEYKIKKEINVVVMIYNFFALMYFSFLFS